ncbi:MAG: T9SS type A sorting domain-containing protein, partial [Flavitalea sp.]
DAYDMPVALANSDQKNPLIIKSDSDGGYFLIWEDLRNGIGNSDIYAQKYDRDGHAIWAVNGIPVATGAATDQQYSHIANGTVNYTNYQNVSHAASDGSGGFYIAWDGYIGSPIGKYAVYVQHIRADGTRAFVEDGNPVLMPNDVSGSYRYPQLVADGKGGFFLGYLFTARNVTNTVVRCYKDEGGVLKGYGGASMSDMIDYFSPNNGYAYCSYTNVGGYNSNPIGNNGMASVNSFKIFPDGQGGCGVVMSVGSQGGQTCFPAFNRLCRIKEDTHVQTVENGTIFYKKDTVIPLYRPSVRYVKFECVPPDAPPVPPGSVFERYVFTVGSQGLMNLIGKKYGFNAFYDDYYPGSGKMNPGNLTHSIEKVNAVLLPTDGNIDAVLVTWNQRDYKNSVLSDWSTRSVVVPLEKYADIPFQLTSAFEGADLANSPYQPPAMNKLNEDLKALDTILAPPAAGTYYDYSLTSSGTRAFVISSLNGLSTGSGPSPFYYQEAKVVRKSADAFAVELNTSQKNGVLVGIGTYNDRFPYIAGDGAGNATFYYVGPNGRDYVKASPLDPGGKLRWGALGLPLNSGGVAGSYYYPQTPAMVMDAGGKGVMAWTDYRRTPDGYTGLNVYMRHLDNLLDADYQPPFLQAQLTVVPPGSGAGSRMTQSNPQTMIGSSKAWTVFQVPVSGATTNVATPVVSIKDDYDLGTVSVSTFEIFNQPLRTVDGKPYLNRNYTISVTNHPSNATIQVRLIFTKDDLDALKAADPTIRDPGDLMVMKQPSNGTAPAAYTPTADDQGIQPSAWGTIQNTVAGVTEISGYYLEFGVTGFSNFVIMKTNAALPVKLRSFTAKAVDNTSLLRWETATESNNDRFDIERSADGRVFTKIGSVASLVGTSTTVQNYQYTDKTPLDASNYYRLAQVDLDGTTTYSEVRLVSFNVKAGVLKVFPNPVKTNLHVQLPQAATGNEKLQLFDLRGVKVLVQSVQAGTIQLDTDISMLMPGVYILRYGNESLRVLKQ